MNLNYSYQCLCDAVLLKGTGVGGGEVGLFVFPRTCWGVAVLTLVRHLLFE